MPTYEQMLTALQTSTTEADKELAGAFVDYPQIKELWDGLFGWDELMAQANEDPSIFGNVFHKSFRQTDVVRGDEGKTDMRVWHLLHQSNAFWDCLAKK